MPRRLTSLFAALAATVCVPATAQMSETSPAVSCPATPAALPAELASWTSARPLAAATKPDALPAATLALGQAVDLALSPTPDVAYSMRPQRPGGSVSSGGMAQFRIVKAGIYRVGIDSAAWLDVLADGKGLTSVAHGHGPDCSGIRKMVDFSLEPGTYTLQIVGNGSPKIRVLVASVPAA